MPPTEEERIQAERDLAVLERDRLAAELLTVRGEYRTQIRGDAVRIVHGERQMLKLDAAGILKLAPDLSDDERADLAPFVTLRDRLEHAMAVESALIAAKAGLAGS